MQKVVLPIGYECNYLKVIGLDRVDKYGRQYYQCKCVCGKIISVRVHELKNKQQSSCSCKHPGNKINHVKCRKKVGKKSHFWKGYGEISGGFWGHILSHAKTRGYIVEITIQDAWKLFLKQNKKCAISGALLCFGKTTKEHRLGATTASLDRINSKLGYTKENVQWVHKEINWMKMDLPQEDFINWCVKIGEYQNEISKNREPC